MFVSCLSLAVRLCCLFLCVCVWRRCSSLFRLFSVSLRFSFINFNFSSGMVISARPAVKKRKVAVTMVMRSRHCITCHRCRTCMNQSKTNKNTQLECWAAWQLKQIYILRIKSFFYFGFRVGFVVLHRVAHFWLPLFSNGN